MYPETLDTGHRVIWSKPETSRTTNLVLVLHDANSTPDTAAEHYFDLLPETTTGLAIQAGFEDTFGHRWFSSNQYTNPNFPEVLSAAHRVFDAIDEDEYGTSNYASIQLVGIGQGAAMATTLLRIRPEALTSLVVINGYVIDNPMLAAFDTPDETSGTPPVLWLGSNDHDAAATQFTRNWLTTRTRVTDAEDTSAITPFLTQNVS